MKYCPYCGASLVGSAASFCAECGRQLPSAEKKESDERIPPQRIKTESKIPNPKLRKPPAGKPNKSATQQRQPVSRQKAPIHKPQPQSPLELRSNPVDEGYDGYYDDVIPIDNGATPDHVASGLVKRIALLAAGAAVIIVLAVIAIYLL